MIRKKILKLISVVMSVSFLWQDVMWAVPSHLPPVICKLSSDIYIPEQYGSIEKPHDLSSTKSQVVLIKDAHCNYEAQRNIAKILDILIKDYKIDLVCVEGASNKVDPSVIADSPDDKRRKEVADEYLKKGYLTSVEVLAMERGKDYGFSIWGVEDLKLYLEDLKAFREVYSGSTSVGRFIEISKNLISNLKNRLYPEDALAFDKKIQTYKDNKLSLTGLIEYLYATDKRGFIKYLNLRLVLKALILEKATNFNKVENERALIIKNIESRYPKEDIQELVKNSLLYKLGKVSSLDYYSYLKRFILPSEYRNYPNLHRYIQIIKIHSKIEEDDLFKELDALIEGIYKIYIKDEISVKLHIIDGYINLLDKLSMLEITRDELIKYRQSVLRINDLIEFIRIQGALNNINVPYELTDSAFIDQLESFYKQPGEFYRYALERDNALINNLVKRMEEAGKDKAIIIIGGFHAEGVEKLLKEKNVQVITITPSITKEDTEAKKIYLSRMMDKRIQPDEMIRQLGLNNLGTQIMTGIEWQDKFSRELDAIKNAAIAARLKGVIEKGFGPEQLKAALRAEIRTIEAEGQIEEDDIVKIGVLKQILGEEVSPTSPERQATPSTGAPTAETGAGPSRRNITVSVGKITGTGVVGFLSALLVDPSSGWTLVKGAVSEAPSFIDNLGSFLSSPGFWFIAVLGIMLVIVLRFSHREEDVQLSRFRSIDLRTIPPFERLNWDVINSIVQNLKGKMIRYRRLDKLGNLEERYRSGYVADAQFVRPNGNQRVYEIKVVGPHGVDEFEFHFSKFNEGSYLGPFQQTSRYGDKWIIIEIDTLKSGAAESETTDDNEFQYNRAQPEGKPGGIEPLPTIPRFNNTFLPEDEEEKSILKGIIESVVTYLSWKWNKLKFFILGFLVAFVIGGGIVVYSHFFNRGEVEGSAKVEQPVKVEQSSSTEVLTQSAPTLGATQSQETLLNELKEKIKNKKLLDFYYDADYAKQLQIIGLLIDLYTKGEYEKEIEDFFVQFYIVDFYDLSDVSDFEVVVDIMYNSFGKFNIEELKREFEKGNSSSLRRLAASFVLAEKDQEFLQKVYNDNNKDIITRVMAMLGLIRGKDKVEFKEFIDPNKLVEEFIAPLVKEMIKTKGGELYIGLLHLINLYHPYDPNDISQLSHEGQFYVLTMQRIASARQLKNIGRLQEIWMNKEFQKGTYTMSPFEKYSLARQLYIDIPNWLKGLELGQHIKDGLGAYKEAFQRVRGRVVLGQGLNVFITGHPDFAHAQETYLGMLEAYIISGTKEEILNNIKGASNNTTIIFNVHANGEVLEFNDTDNGTISYQELANAFIDGIPSKDFSGMTIIIDGCYAPHFIINFLSYMLEKGVPLDNLPIVIGASGIGETARADIFALSLDEILRQKGFGSVITCGDILDAKGLFSSQEFTIFIPLIKFGVYQKMIPKSGDRRGSRAPRGIITWPKGIFLADTKGSQRGAMKPVSTREEDDPIYREYVAFMKGILTEENMRKYERQAKEGDRIEGEAPYFLAEDSFGEDGIPAFHFIDSNNRVIFVVNKDRTPGIVEEAIYHELQEVYWKSIDLEIIPSDSLDIAHIIASAKQVKRYGQRELTQYHRSQLLNYLRRGLRDYLLRLSKENRKRHHRVLDLANERADAGIDIDMVKQYEFMFQQIARILAIEGITSKDIKDGALSLKLKPIRDIVTGRFGYSREGEEIWKSICEQAESIFIEYEGSTRDIHTVSPSSGTSEEIINTFGLSEEDIEKSGIKEKVKKIAAKGGNVIERFRLLLEAIKMVNEYLKRKTESKEIVTACDIALGSKEFIRSSIWDGLLGLFTDENTPGETKERISYIINRLSPPVPKRKEPKRDLVTLEDWRKGKSREDILEALEGKGFFKSDSENIEYSRNKLEDVVTKLGLQRGQRYLHVGASYSRVVILLTLLGVECTYLDMLPVTLIPLREKLKDVFDGLGIVYDSEKPPVKFVRCNIDSADSEMRDLAGSFDVITMFHVFFQFRGNLELGTRNLLMLVKPGGTIWFTPRTALGNWRSFLQTSSELSDLVLGFRNAADEYFGGSISIEGPSEEDIEKGGGSGYCGKYGIKGSYPELDDRDNPNPFRGYNFGYKVIKKESGAETKPQAIDSTASEPHLEEFVKPQAKIKEEYIGSFGGPLGFDEALRIIEQEGTPEGALLLVEGPLEVGHFKEISKLSFEVGLFRIRDTNKWIITKGNCEQVQIGHVFSKYDVAISLFDVFIHNHPPQKEPLPSYVDFMGGVTRPGMNAWVIGKNGMTFLDSSKMRVSDDEEEDIFPQGEVIEKRIPEGGFEKDEEGDYTEDAKKMIKGIYKDFNINWHFYTWEEMEHQELTLGTRELRDIIFSPMRRERFYALKELLKIAEPTAETAHFIKKFSEDSSRQIQKLVLEYLEKHRNRENEKDAFIDSIRAFCSSNMPDVQYRAFQALFADGVKDDILIDAFRKVIEKFGLLKVLQNISPQGKVARVIADNFRKEIGELTEEGQANPQDFSKTLIGVLLLCGHRSFIEHNLTIAEGSILENLIECLGGYTEGIEIIRNYLKANFNNLKPEIQFVCVKVIIKNTPEDTDGYKEAKAYLLQIPFEYFHEMAWNWEKDPGGGDTRFVAHFLRDHPDKRGAIMADVAVETRSTTSLDESRELYLQRVSNMLANQLKPLQLETLVVKQIPPIPTIVPREFETLEAIGESEAPQTGPSRGYGGEENVYFTPKIREALGVDENGKVIEGAKRNFACVTYNKDAEIVKETLTMDEGGEISGEMQLDGSERANLQAAIDLLRQGLPEEDISLIFIPGIEPHYGVTRAQIYLDKILLADGQRDALRRRLRHELKERQMEKEGMRPEEAHKQLVIEELAELLGLGKGKDTKEELARILEGETVELLHTLRGLLITDVTSETELRGRLQIIFESAEKVVRILNMVKDNLPEDIRANLSKIQEALTIYLAVNEMRRRKEDQKMPKFLKELSSQLKALASDKGFDLDMIDNLMEEIREADGYYAEPGPGGEIKIISSPYFLQIVDWIRTVFGEELNGLLEKLNRYKYAEAVAKSKFKITTDGVVTSPEQIHSTVVNYLGGRPGSNSVEALMTLVEVIARYVASKEEILDWFKGEERKVVSGGLKNLTGRDELYSKIPALPEGNLSEIAEAINNIPAEDVEGGNVYYLGSGGYRGIVKAGPIDRLDTEIGDTTGNGLRGVLSKFMRVLGRDYLLLSKKPRQFISALYGIKQMEAELDKMLGDKPKWQDDIPLIVEAKTLVGRDAQANNDGTYTIMPNGEGAVWLLKERAELGIVEILYDGTEKEKEATRLWLLEHGVNLENIMFITVTEYPTEGKAVCLLSEDTVGKLGKSIPGTHRVIKCKMDSRTDNRVDSDITDMALASRAAAILGSYEKLDEIDIKEKFGRLYSACGLTKEEIKKYVAQINIKEGIALVIGLPPITPFMKVYCDMLKSTKEIVASAA